MEKFKIAVDGSCEGNPGLSEYKGVDLDSGIVLFHVKLGYATNNIAEFIALCHGVFFAIDRGIGAIIYTDSVTAMSWFRKKEINSSLKNTEKTQKAIDYINRCLKKLKTIDVKYEDYELMANDVLIKKWNTRQNGENPADFNKKNN